MRHRRVMIAVLCIATGCGGTLATVHVPPLPEPPASKFESFEAWDARVNPATCPTSAP